MECIYKKFIFHIYYRLKNYNPDTNIAVIEYNNVELNVDTSLIDQFHCRINGLVRFVGKIDKKVFCARVYNVFESMNIKLFDQTLQLRRKFLQYGKIE